MGVIRRGILGGFSGSVGNVVGSSWKGIATMKAKPLSVANPNTAAQVAQRSKMTNLVEFAKQILTTIIKPLNDRFASGMSGFNLFTQRNIDLFAAASPNPAGDLILSSGNVEPVAGLSASGAAAQPNVAVVATDNTGTGNALATDEIYLVVENVNTGAIVAGGAIAARSAMGPPIPVNMGANLVSGDVINVWASYRRADGTQVSNTEFFTYTVA